MTHNFPYLTDSSFLKKFDELKLKVQYAKIIVLTFNEKPIKEIQGKVAGGSFNIDGSSAMRRTANLSIVADEYENNLTDTKNLLSINKKVEILVGFDNTTDQYTEFPILWFPQGIYVITAPNISHSKDGTSISLTLHDKMALLNGECGGTLPASVTFSEYETVDADGNTIIEQPTIYQIIQELVNHFGGEQLGKIIISDVDTRIKQVMKWTGSTPLYIYTRGEGQGLDYHHVTTNLAEVEAMIAEGGSYQTYEYGEDVGYILTDFVYPGELVGNIGDTVVTILDKIKNTLGNYEYFYDMDGNFRFQEVKNYLNTTFATQKLKDISQEELRTINEIEATDYASDFTGDKSVYTFDNAEIIQSFSNTPQYQQIKNDFLVWGKRTTITGQEIPIRYHLAIDNKPEVGNMYNVFFYKDPTDGVVKAAAPIEFENVSEFPETGEVGLYYCAKDTDTIYEWNPVDHTYDATQYVLQPVRSTDYRTELYLQGVDAEPMGLESNYYYAELKNEWPKLYDVERQRFYEETLNNPSNIDYFLDFIDASADIGELSVENIGRRTQTIVDEKINCLFEPGIEDLVIIEKGTDKTAELAEECHTRGQEYVQVESEIYNLLLIGGVLRSAYEEIRTELYQYTTYNEQISLTTLPIYYLQPNVRITVRDSESGIYGDYMIKSISLPLDVNGTMNISCTRALERI